MIVVAHRLMERLNHPHLIRMLEMIDSPKRIHIVMEYAGGYVAAHAYESLREYVCIGGSVGARVGVWVQQ